MVEGPVSLSTTGLGLLEQLALPPAAVEEGHVGNVGCARKDLRERENSLSRGKSFALGQSPRTHRAQRGLRPGLFPRASVVSKLGRPSKEWMLWWLLF